MSAQQMLLTGRGMGAIAVVLLRGAGAREVVARATGARVRGMGVGDVALVKIRAEDGSAVDEALVVAVGEEAWELHVHGGVAAVDQVMRLLDQAGAQRVAEEDEGAVAAAHTGGVWARGVGVEIVQALPAAQSRTAVRLLAAQREGGLSGWARGWRERLAVGVALWVFQSEAQWVLERARGLRWLIEQPRVAIVGPPNAGKSTLANALLGRNMSITSAIAGTTRDWVDAAVMLTGAGTQMAATLVDTAGVRATDDPLEQMAIARTGEQAALADAVIAVVDGSATLEAGTKDWLRGMARRRMVLAINKADRERALNHEDTDLAAPAVAISALHAKGIDALMEKVIGVLGLGPVADDEPWVFTPRQRTVMERAALAHTAAQAETALAELLGE